MIVILSNNKYMYKTVLPEKVAGRYWLKDDFNGRMRNLICVEASNGKWIAKSNKNATFYNYDNETVDSVEIINGMAHILKTREDEKTLLFADTYTSSGSEFVRYYIPVNTDITIGRETGNTIVYNNKFVSANHTIIRRNNDVWTIQDNNSTNGTYVNNTRIGLDTLVPGDTIYIMGLRIIIGNDFISINNPNKNVVCDENVLKKMFESETKLFLIKDDESETDNFFYRSPRLTSRIDTLKFRVSPPIAQQDTEKTPMAMMIGPSLTMGMGSASTAAFSVINAVGRNASISSIAPTLIMAVAMMSGTVLWPTITKKYEKRQKSRLENKRQSKYREYLTETKDRIIKAIREQSEILQSNNVSLTECEDIIMLAKRNLWERTIGQDDFLEVRIGIGDKPLDAEIDFPERGFTIEEDNLWDDLQALSNTPRILKNVPITYSLIKNSVSGIVGKDLNIVYDFIKCLVIRIASDYSYDEVKIMVIADSDDQNNWDYIKWIPHIWDNSKNMRFFVSNENDANEMFAYIDKIIEGYNNADRETEIGQYYIIFNASKELTKKSETMKKIYTDGEQYGFSVFCITDEIRNLPKECSEIIEISENESKIYDKHDISGNCQSFKADTKLVHSINSLVRKLSGIKLDLSSTSEVLPSMLTFLEMYNVSKIEHLNIRTRWKENNPTVTLKAPVGVDTLGNLFYLDLHEKYQGPHGLVAGMTGSGKSEFIITYILSMAVNYHPDEVAFILIDYKGGGLAGAFENKKKGIKLPHLAGTITNLDGASINRSLVSIQSELRKRQSIFNEAKQISNEGTMDIYKYQKLYREGIVTEPVPHLFIISDEFAELKTQQPDFMDQLISTAINIVKERGLDCDITYKEDENVAEGCVVSQSVAAGTQAKAGDVISLVVSSGPPKFDMIDVVGEQHKDAEEKLHELGLVVTVDYIYDENYELGTVIKQSEEKGAKVYKGYEITITVVSDEALINVPDVVGKDFDEATEMITSANLKVEKNEIYDNNVAAGLVISQAPQAGSSQKGGTKILLTVSLGKQPVTVKFNSLGGTCQESERTVYYTETYGELPVPTMQYHKFLGWYTAEKSGSQVEADTKVNNVNSQTLYARWERIYVRVAFDANGGKVGTSSTNIAMGEKYSLPTPERKYYSFDGWYTEKNGGTKVTSSDVMSTGERHTLYAHWTVKSVTVTYDAGSGSITGDANVKYNLGTEYGKKLATRTGYTFMGWYTKANGSGTKVLETDIVTDEKEHTLYAYWSNKAITITLDPRSGTLSERSIKAEYDKEYGTLPTPERKGYTFEGWYTSASGGDRVTESSVCKDEKDATLYARWAEIYVTNITLSKNANETTYYIGDTVKVTGAVITATYNDGSTAEISADDSRVGKNYPDMNSAGNKNVTLSFGGKNYSYLISVKTPSISINGGTNGNRTSQLTASYDVGNQENISINWSSSDTSVATVNNGYVAFNKNKGSNASTVITASYNYKGRTYKATRTLRIEYGSWSGESENYVAESDTRHVHTRSKTDTTESESASLNGWTRTAERKVYTGDWESGHRRDTEMPEDTGDAEWWLESTDYHYWHYHNKYPEGGGGIDSTGINSYGKCEFYSADEGKQTNKAPDKGGRGYGYCGLEKYHQCPWGWTAYWREKNYIYKRRPYKKIYTYSRTYTIYSYCDIRYCY